MIDEWLGWLWICYNCDYEDRFANYKEIEEYEKEHEHDYE